MQKVKVSVCMDNWLTNMYVPSGILQPDNVRSAGASLTMIAGGHSLSVSSST